MWTPLLRCVALPLALLSCNAAMAAWPDDRPIELVVGFAPGGGTDQMARLLAPFVSKRLSPNARIVVTNKPGAAGELAVMHVVRAKPDGYTLGIVNVPGFIFVPMYKDAQYKADDVRLIARLVDDPTVLVARKDSQFKDLSGVVLALKKQPGSLSFAHSGVGTNGHIALEQIQKVAGVQANSIPFKGAAEVKTALLGKHVDFTFMSVGEMRELSLAGGPFKGVAQMSKTRLAAIGSVPTALEAGVPVAMSSERGVAAPAQVPADIAHRLETAIEESLRDPAFIAAAKNDAPVLAYLPGKAWTTALAANRTQLQPIADALREPQKVTQK
ncbi:tripartite tricarboxylate transporter substrate binding protein [Cupriavidus sp. PET2-C1]